ncbi:hypothetical protein Dimus_013080 [Dionaea muscipula]
MGCTTSRMIFGRADACRILPDTSSSHSDDDKSTHQQRHAPNDQGRDHSDKHVYCVNDVCYLTSIQTKVEEMNSKEGSLIPNHDVDDVQKLSSCKDEYDGGRSCSHIQEIISTCPLRSSPSFDVYVKQPTKSKYSTGDTNKIDGRSHVLKMEHEQLDHKDTMASSDHMVMMAKKLQAPQSTDLPFHSNQVPLEKSWMNTKLIAKLIGRVLAVHKKGSGHSINNLCTASDGYRPYKDSPSNSGRPMRSTGKIEM